MTYAEEKTLQATLVVVGLIIAITLAIAGSAQPEVPYSPQQQATVNCLVNSKYCAINQ